MTKIIVLDAKSDFTITLPPHEHTVEFMEPKVPGMRVTIIHPSTGEVRHEVWNGPMVIDFSGGAEVRLSLKS